MISAAPEMLFRRATQIHFLLSNGNDTGAVVYYSL